MALPIGVPTVTCTLSKPLLAQGTEGSITSAFLKIDRDLVWVDTGETIYKDSAPVSIPSDGNLSFPAIPVDIPGMRDTGGNTITHWTYTLRVTLTLLSGVTRVTDYMFQPEITGGVMDLDLIPHLNAFIIPPVLVPVPSVIDGGNP